MIGEWLRRMRSREGWPERWSEIEGLEIREGRYPRFYWRFGLIRTHLVVVGEPMVYGVLIIGHSI